MSATRAILIIATITGTIAGPLSFWGDEVTTSGTSCSDSTCPESLKFRYEPQKTYQYSYSTQVITTVGGAMDEYSSLNMAALVNLEVLSPCEMLIRLTDVSIQDIEPGTHAEPSHVERAMEFKRALQAYPMRFSFHDGAVEHVCPDPQDEIWVKNVKRAIISALQNKMPTLETNTNLPEDDISGSCMAEYEVVNRGWSNTNIRKTKNLLSCTDRQHVESAFQGTPYRVPSKFQSLPILKGSYECNQKISKSKILQSSICHESQIFRPFSKYDSGALTNITSTLTFNSVRNQVRTSMDEVRSRESLKFEHSHEEITPEESSASRTKAQRVLRQLCRTSTDDVRPETPALFAELVREVRKLNADNLNDLHEDVRGGRPCEKAERFFRDAIPMLGTSTAVSFIREMIKENHLSDTEADLWLSSMAFISVPTRDMLIEAKQMLQEIPRQKVILAVTSLTNTYCKHVERCQVLTEVQEIVSHLKETLRYNCMINNDEQYDTILVALKGLGNIGYSNDAADALNRCSINRDAPLTIRLAAINAFRRMPCEADQSEMLQILRDDTNDAELRITAYLALMACPDSSIIRDVAELLRRETINQVGSFIWTHLTNLMETSHVFKKEIRSIVQNQYLEREFDMDKRKFSRNYEWSTFSDWMNTGAMVESNMIWSEKSFIPRSAMVNMTVDMFGDSFNLFEAGGRLEGFEDILAKIFGHSSNEVERPRRSSNNDINTLDNEYNIDQSEPEGSYFLRFFGNEISYGSFRGLDFDSLWNRVNYLQWLINLSKEHHYDITKSFMFLESSMVIPTIAGFPLKLDVEGSTTMEAKINGHLDLRQMASSPRSLSIVGNVQPSAAIEISGSMGVDAFMAKTGLKMTNTLHTSTLTSVNIELQNGQILNMNLNTPREKLEVFTASSKFYLIYRDEKREQSMLQEDTVEKQSCFSTPEMTKIIGMEMCGHVSYPSVFSEVGKPWMPLAGPMEAKLELMKRDTMTGYTVQLKWIRDASGVYTGLASFNTPGSRINRELTLDMQLDNNQKSMHFNLRSPWKRIEMGADMALDRYEQKRLNAHLVIDEETQYRLNSLIRIENNRQSWRYEPQVEITIPNRRPIRIGGSVMYRGSQRGSIELNIENVLPEPISLQGTVNQQETNRRSRFTVEFQTSSPYLMTNVNGYVNLPKDGNGGSSRMEVDYRMGSQGRDERLVFSSKWRDDQSPRRRELTLSGSVASTRHASLNNAFLASVTKTANGLRSHIEGGSEGSNRLTLDQNYSFDFDGRETALQGAVQLQWPIKNIDYTLETHQIWGESRQKSAVTIQYSPNKRVGYSLDHQLPSQTPLQSSFSGSMNVDHYEMTIAQQIRETGSGQYRYDLTAENFKGQRLSVNGNYAKHPRHELTGTVSLSGYPEVVINGHLQPQLNNFDMRFESRHGQKVHLIEYTSRLNGNWNQFDYTTNVKLGCTPYLEHFTAEANKNGDRLSTNAQYQRNMDQSNRLSQLFSVHTEVVTIKNNPGVQMRVEWNPNQFLEISAGAELQTGGYYNPEMHLRSNATIRSSLESLSNVRLIYNVDNVHPRTSVHTELTYAPGKAIVEDFVLHKISGWSQIEMSYEATTPFAYYRNVRLAHDHNLQEGLLNINQDYRVGSAQGRLGVNCRREDSNNQLDCTIDVNSPLRNWENINFNMQHRNNGRQYTSNLRASVNRQEASVAFSMDHFNRGMYITNNGELTVLLPIANFQKTKLSWNHKNTENIFKCHHELEWQGRRSVIDIDSSFRFDRSNSIHFAAFGNCPYSEDIRASFDYLTNSSIFQTSASAQWTSDKAIRFSCQAQKLSQSLEFTSPFAGYERITYSGDANYEPFFKLQWAPSKIITYSHRLHVHPTGEADMLLKLTTPFRNVENTEVRFSNNKQNNVWEQIGSIHYGQNQQISLETSVEMTNRRRIQINVRTPFRSIDSLLLDIQQTGTARNFDARASFSCSPNIGEYTATARFNADNLQDINGNIEIETPLPRYRFIRMVLNHAHADEIASTGTLELPGRRYSFTETIAFNNIRDFTTNTVVEYEQGQSVQINTVFNVGQEIDIQLRIKTPFMEDIRVEVTHTGRLSNFECNLIVESPMGNVNGHARFRMTDSESNGLIQLDMPLFSVPRISANLEHNGDVSNFRTNAGLTYADQTISLSAERTNSNRQMSMNIELATPFNDYRNNRLNYNLNHNGLSFNAQLSCGNVVRSEVRINGQGNRREASLSLTTPITGTISASGNSQGTLTKFTGQIESTINRESYSSEVTFDIESSRKVGQIVLNLPIRQYRRVEFGVTVEGNLKEFSTTSKFRVNNEQYTSNLDVNLISSRKQVSMAVTTPDGDVSSTVEYSGVPTNFEGNLNLNFFRKAFTVETRVDVESNAKTISVNVNSPVVGYESIGFEVNHSGSLSKFNTDINSRVNRNRYSASTDLDFTRSTKRVTASYSTPIPGYEQASLALTHSGNLADFETGLVITKNNEDLSLNINVDFAADEKSVTFSLNTPYRNYESNSLSLRHRGNRDNFETSLDVTVMRQTVSTSFACDLLGRSKRISINVETPFSGYQTSSLNLVYNGVLYEHTSSIEALFRGKTVSFSCNTNLNSPEKSISLSLNTPVPGFERNTATWTFSGQSNNFNNDVGVSVNGYDVSVGIVGRFDANTKSLSLNFNSPVKTVTLQGMVNGEWLNHNTEAAVIINGNRYAYATELSTTRTDVSGSFILTTPHQLLNRIAMRLSHSGKKWFFRDSLTIEINEESVTASTLFRWMERTNTLKLNGEVAINQQSYSVNIQHSGDWSNMEDNFTINMGSQRIQGSSQISIGNAGVQATATVNTPFEGLRNIAASLNHNNNYGTYRSSGSLSVPAISYDISHSKTASGIQSSGSLDLPFRSLPRLEYEIQHSGDSSNFETSATGSANGKRFGLNVQHGGNSQQFRTRVEVQTPLNSVPICSITWAHRGSIHDFEERVTVEYSGRQLEGSVGYTAQQQRSYGYSSGNSAHVLDAQLTTPYRNWNGQLHTEFRKQGLDYTIATQVTHASQQVLDVEYSLNLGDQKSLSVVMRRPETLTGSIRYSSTPVTKKIEYEVSKRGYSSAVVVEIKNTDNLKGILFSAELPSGRTFVGTNYTLTGDRFVHVLDVNNEYISRVEGTMSQQRGRLLVDGLLSVNTPEKDIHISLSHQTNNNRRVSTITFGRERPLTIRKECSSSGNDFTSDLTISHPSLISDITVAVRGTIDLNTPVFDGSIVAVMENERVSFVGRIADESSYSQKRYVANCHLTHPGTYTDFEYTSSIENNGDVVALNMQTAYKFTRDKQTRTSQLRIGLNKPRKQIEIALVTPPLNAELTGQLLAWDIEQGVLEATYTGQYNGQNVQGEIAYRKNERYLAIQIISDDLTARLISRYESDQLYNFEIFHIKSGRRIQDAQVRMQLLDSRRLQTRLFVRPELISDVKSLAAPSYGQQNMVVAAVSSFGDDLIYKKQYAKRSFSKLIDLISDVNEWIEQQTEAIQQSLRRAFYENKFYIRTIYERSNELYEMIMRKIAAAKVNMNEHARQWRQNYHQWSADMNASMRRAYGDLQQKMVDSMEAAKRHSSNMARKFNDMYDDHARPHVDRMNNYMNDVYNNRVVPLVYNERVRRVMSVAATEYVTPVTEWYQGVVTSYNQFLIKLSDLWRQIEQSEQYIQLREYVQTWLEHTQWWYEYLEIEEFIMSNLKHLRGYSVQNIINNGLQLIKDYTGIDQSRFTAYNPRGGEIEAVLYLPFEMIDLRTMPDVNIQRYVNTVERYMDRYLPDISNFYLLDPYYAYKLPSDLHELLPPFKAHATITGAQSYMTFDHKFMEFSGECSYLLARDFIDGKFSVIVNYDNVQGQTTKKSITVLSDDQEIEIYPDSKIMLNNRRTELPIDLPKTSVIREGELIKVTNKHGLQITCNLPYDSCQIQVSGFYYGKTAGLLGTYDNEPETDMMMTNKLKASSPEELANSWTVGRRCRIRNNAHIDSYPSGRREEACRRVFEDNSSVFRACFKIVNPAAAMKMCIDRPPSGSNSLEDEVDVCQAASFYVQDCRQHSIELSMPDQCVKCSLSDGRKFSKPDNVTIAASHSPYSVPQSADVVFVVSHGECNREATQRINNIVTLLDNGLQREGLNGNRYALVGYGGINSHLSAHAHTMSGQIFSDKNSLINSVLNNFEIMSQDTESEDSMSAIKYATGLSFRAGVSKTIILVPCYSCHERNSNYDEVQQLLNDQDIRLHVLMDHDFSIRSRTVKTSFIFGVDRDSLFNGKHVGETPLVGAQDMRPHVIMPKDICAALAEVTDGSVFNVAKMTESRPFIQKKFIDVFTRLIVKKAEPTDCQICDCVEDVSGIGKSICRRCQPIPVESRLMSNLQEIFDQDDNEDDFEQDLQKYIEANEPFRKYKNKKLRTKNYRKRA